MLSELAQYNLGYREFWVILQFLFLFLVFLSWVRWPLNSFIRGDPGMQLRDRDYDLTPNQTA